MRKTKTIAVVLIPHTLFEGSVTILLLGVVFGAVPYVLIPWAWSMLTTPGVAL